jgi:hypothetical protein
MPKLSDRDTFKKLRALGNDVPLDVCIGYVIDPDEFMILSQGHPPPVDIMHKPYFFDGLSKALAKAVHKTQEREPVFSFTITRAQFAHPLPMHVS